METWLVLPTAGMRNSIGGDLALTGLGPMESTTIRTWA
jgi:hypothetical protein